MERNRNYDRNEVFTMADNLRNIIGDEELIENVFRGLDVDEASEILCYIARQFDCKEEMLQGVK